MSSVNSSSSTDYSSLLNSLKTSYAENLLGSMDDVEIISGISGSLLQQWAQLGANSSAYRALLAAEETGTVKQDSYYKELLSDKLFNDYYDSETRSYSATYTPSTSSGIEIDNDSTAADVLGDMRSLALAAIGNTSTLNSVHYDYFETMRASIANSLVTDDSSSTTTVTTSDAQAGSVAGSADFRLLEADQSFVVAGTSGEKTYSFGLGTSLEEIVSAINADSAETGVNADLVEKDDGTYDIELTSTGTGADQYVRVDQLEGDLFTSAGSSLSGMGTDAVTSEAEVVAGSTASGASITSLSELGQISIDGVTYSFADLATGGKASLSNNPDAALAVLDQTLEDINSGKAELSW